MATEAEVIKKLGAFAKITGRELSAEALTFYADVLLDELDPDEALAALRKWAASPRGDRFPSAGQLIGIAHPEVEERDEANEAANKLLGLISRKGYTWSSTYRYDGHATLEAAINTEAGPGAWGVVEQCGGWPEFCRQFDQGLNSNARPQLRDLLESRSKIAQRSDAKLLGQRQSNGLTSAADIVRALNAPKDEALKAQFDRDVAKIDTAKLAF
jgi:hypothetical protein